MHEPNHGTSPKVPALKDDPHYVHMRLGGGRAVALWALRVIDRAREAGRPSFDDGTWIEHDERMDDDYWNPAVPLALDEVESGRAAEPSDCRELRALLEPHVAALMARRPGGAK